MITFMAGKRKDHLKSDYLNLIEYAMLVGIVNM